MAECLIVSCRTQWSEQLNCRWMSDKSWCYEMDVHERGTWQLCHVRRLAFPLNISFYLMQHTRLWRSKFRILTKEEAHKNKNSENFAHKFKPSPGHPTGSFTKTNLRKVGDITDKVWWLSRAYKCSRGRGSRGFAFVCNCILLSFYH